MVASDRKPVCHGSHACEVCCPALQLRGATCSSMRCCSAAHTALRQPPTNLPLPLIGAHARRGTSLCLAVLHPRKLVVYAVQPVGSAYLQLSRLYEHVLQRTAANMAVGGFGGTQGGLGRDW